MSTHVEIESDNWHAVQDPKKRKQIQDRLAQRARRGRLANQKNAAEVRQTQVATPDDSPGRSPEGQSQDVMAPTEGALDTFSRAVQSGAVSSSSSLTPDEMAALGPSIGADHNLLTKHVSTVFAALFNNGRILGIACGVQVPILSRPCTAKVPLSLHPTEAQMTILHIPWIDRFPFPRMRDNCIRLSSVIDEEEFLEDLFTTDSFTIAPNSVSWEPSAWIVAQPFEKKWGYLFY